MSVDPALIARTTAGFREAFHRDPDVVAFAPGRVNLIGEHTDYNNGFVFPCALDFGTVVALGSRADRRINVRAIDLGDKHGSFDLDPVISREANGHWENHVRGVASAMPVFGLPVAGADIVISGNVPQGAGLSSSASLGVALAHGLAKLAGCDEPDRMALAKIAQWSEHNYVGCACGMMDQLASAFGEDGKALLIDCMDNSIQAVAFPDDAIFMIVHSGVTRGLVDSAYNERRSQCEQAAAHYGVASLRDLTPEVLMSEKGNLDETVFRRAAHVVSENERTLSAFHAMTAGDLATIGTAMRASHISLRDDFEVSLPPIDALVDCLAKAIGSEGGARMTGGGFGGCVVAILPKAKFETVNAALNAHWQQIRMAPQLVIVTQPATGAHLSTGPLD